MPIQRTLTNTYLLTNPEAIGAITILPVKDWCFPCIDEVGKNRCDDSHQRTQDPALCAVKEGLYASPYVFPAPESFDPEGIRYAIVYPVGRCKLIVPNAIIGKPSPFRLCHGIFAGVA
jgi:hypothetical protein